MLLFNLKAFSFQPKRNDVMPSEDVSIDSTIEAGM